MRAREIAAVNDIHNNQESLRAITGHSYKRLKPLKKSIPLRTPKPKSISVWEQRALNQNLDLLAAKLSHQSAHALVQAQNANHLPTLDIVGRYDRSLIDTTEQSPRKNEAISARLQLSLPIFQGGQIIARTNQAIHERTIAKENCVAARRGAVRLTRQSYNNVVSGVSQIKASRQAIRSAKSSLESTEAALKVGTRTIVDLLNAQRDLFQSQKKSSRHPIPLHYRHACPKTCRWHIERAGLSSD